MEIRRPGPERQTDQQRLSAPPESCRLTLMSGRESETETETETETVSLLDLSSQGFRTEWPTQLAPGDAVWLKLPGMESMSAKVTWEMDNMIGCKFDVRMHPTHYALSLAKIDSLQRSADLN